MPGGILKKTNTIRQNLQQVSIETDQSKGGIEYRLLKARASKSSIARLSTNQLIPDTPISEYKQQPRESDLININNNKRYNNKEDEEDKENIAEIEARIFALDIEDTGIGLPDVPHLPTQFDKQAFKRAAKYNNLVDLDKEDKEYVIFNKNITNNIDNAEDIQIKQLKVVPIPAPIFILLPPIPTAQCSTELVEGDKSQLL